jgi:hypothetical protein
LKVLSHIFANLLSHASGGVQGPEFENFVDFTQAAPKGPVSSLSLIPPESVAESPAGENKANNSGH